MNMLGAPKYTVNILLAHKVALELTLSTQHKGYVLNPQISQREGWGRATKA
jgi:hypothetical protein